MPPSAIPNPNPNPTPNPNHQAFIADWLPQVLSVVPLTPGLDPAQVRQSTLILLDFLRPRDPAQAVIAGLCIATLFAGLEALRQSQEPGLPPQLAARLRGSYFTAVRMVLTMTRRLQQDRGEAPTSFLPDLPELAAVSAPSAARPQNPMHQNAPPARPAPPPPAKAPPPPSAVQPPPASAPQITPRQFNPMPSENGTAASLGALLATAAAPGQPPMPPAALTHKQRKAAKYAQRRASALGGQAQP